MDAFSSEDLLTWAAKHRKVLVNINNLYELATALFIFQAKAMNKNCTKSLIKAA